MSYQVIKQFLKSALMHVSRQKKIMTLAFPTVVKKFFTTPAFGQGSEKFVTTPAFGRGSDKFAVFFLGYRKSARVMRT